MAVTQYRSGGSTITLTIPDSLTLRAMLERAMGGALKAMEEPMEALAADARAAWYGPNGVERETGKSGDIQTRTVVNIDKATVTVSVGSTDTSTVSKRNYGAKAEKFGSHTSVYRVSYIHRPSTASLRPKAVSQAAWAEWSRSGAPTLPPPPSSFGRRDGKARSEASMKAEAASVKFWNDKKKTEGLTVGLWYIQTTEGVGGNAVAPNDPTYRLLPWLVTKPGKKLAKQIAPEVAREIAKAVNRGG